ncbi:hypothetical protein HYC85_002978 [Camellia sinensis]|uniref:LOB domain-containing protein n=2 Tax=Camellia sinensis TaxID=4442 RepID=A0A7J7I9X7_CAMSI|nr:hypothetical protein HYC85_002978 [Camellia sinensis]
MTRLIKISTGFTKRSVIIYLQCTHCKINMTVKGGTSQACAACKYQRRKCSSECPLAPYFPANQPKMFQNSHRLFGVCNIMKILRQLDNQDQKDEAMKSVIYESDMREKFPVHGCCGIIRHLYGQLVQAVEELQYVQARLVICREECHNQVVDHHFPPSSELQLGMNSTGNGLIVLQHHSPGANAMMPLDANQFVMNGNNGVYVEPNDDIVKGLWIQHPNYNNSGNDHVGIQSQLNIPESEVFPIQQQIEIDYDDIPFDTIADDRQSYIESKEACDSCCESPWKDITRPIEHVSKNELKSAAACFSLTSVN